MRERRIRTHGMEVPDRRLLFGNGDRIENLNRVLAHFYSVKSDDFEQGIRRRRGTISGCFEDRR